MSFEKIEKQSVSDIVFGRIQQEILDGNFKPGDKLPSEGTLSEMLGVSRSSVKVAIQRLVTLGLIETRAGDGSYVQSFDASGYLNQVYKFLLSDGDIAHITEYRMYTEMATIRLAVKNADEKNFERMESLLWKMEDAIKNRDIVLHGEYDYQFHLEICNSTKNDIFVLSYKVIGKTLRQHTTKLNEGFFKKAINQQPGEDVHWKLYRAIKEKNLDVCKGCLAEMFSVYESIPAETLESC